MNRTTIQNSTHEHTGIYITLDISLQRVNINLHKSNNSEYSPDQHKML